MAKRYVCGICGLAAIRKVVSRHKRTGNCISGGAWKITFTHASKKAEKDHKVMEACSPKEFTDAERIVAHWVRLMARQWKEAV
jgi:hypothetical protein